MAVSGGADSVALLALLRQQHPETELVAAHFEHGIRGESSREDARFVRALCAQWGIPLREGSADVPALAKRRGIGLEQAAREARYAFLRECMRETGCEAICLAHHLDDQAETVLMHLLRGTGLTGLQGMAEESGDLLRPLLRIRRSELREYLEKRGIPWREDETNQLDDNPRNALRLRAMPVLEEIYPGAAEAVARLSRIAAVEESYMAAEAERYAARQARRLAIGWRIGLSGHEALLRRVVRLKLPDLDADTCEEIMRLCAAGRGAANLSKGGRAEVTGGKLYLLTGPIEPVEAPLTERTDLGALGVITAVPWTGGPVRDDPFTQALDQEALSGAVARSRRPGDYIVPLGMHGRQKLSDYLINRHMDRPMRDLLPVVAQGSEVLWAVGAGISEHAKWREGRPALRLHYIEYTGE